MTNSALRFQKTAPLSLREKIAQLIFCRIGSNLPPIRTVEEDEQRVAQLLTECPIGGLLLFNGGPETKSSLERLQAMSQVPLLVASDVERGLGQQVRGHTLFPHAMAFGRLPEAEGNQAIDRFAAIVSHEARQVGIQIVLGPVADVNTNPRNPIIASRAFSEEPERAAQLVAYFINRLRGVLATAKHFPGHGHTEQDSHATLPVVSRSFKELEDCELMPFEAAIEAECRLIMTAHVAYPALDPTCVPATLSPVILQKLLREEMGFDGVICTDSLLMAGVRDRFESEGELALAALLAGNDLLLDVDEPARAVDYLCQCVANGRLDESRVDDAWFRVHRMKEWMAPNQMSWDEYARMALDQVARGAIEVVGGNKPALIPLVADRPLATVLLKPFATSLEPPEQPLAAALRERFQDVTYVQLGPQAEPAEYKAARELAQTAAQVMVAIIVRPAAWHDFGLKPQQSEFVRQVTRDRQDMVLASLGVPYALAEYPDAAVRICAYSDVPVSQQALVDFLLLGSEPAARARE
jgi:beta-N-acetylhexosaminidase